METFLDLDDLYKKVSNGEEVKCPVCEQGNIVPIINGYACEHCKTKLNHD